MSTTATSGRCASALRRKASASPACPTTSKPPSASSRAIPSRMRTSSSPMTTRTASDTWSRYSPPPWRASCPLFGRQQPAQLAVGQLVLWHKRQPAASVASVQDAPGVPVGRGQNNTRCPRQRRELVREVDPFAIRQTDVDEHPVRPGRVRCLDRGSRVRCRRHDLDSHARQGSLCERQEGRIVVDHKYGKGHRAIIAPVPPRKGRDNPRSGGGGAFLPLRFGFSGGWSRAEGYMRATPC